MRGLCVLSRHRHGATEEQGGGGKITGGGPSGEQGVGDGARRARAAALPTLRTAGALGLGPADMAAMLPHPLLAAGWASV